MPPESHKEFALRRFVETRLLDQDYMKEHSLEDLKQSALRRRYVENFDAIWKECVNRIKGRKK